MFNKLPGFTKESIRSYVELDGNEFIFDCWLPPIGYGLSSVTGELEKTDVLKRSLNKKDQYWERPQIPADWAKRRKDEKRFRDQQAARGQEVDYFDPVCMAFERQEWKRRLCGCWYYNNGVATYLTGTHYMYLTHWKFDGKFLDYRKYDKEFFYIWDYVVEDPNCIGLNYVTKRKSGKTAKSGIVMYEPISRTSNVHGGLQSKGDKDGEEVFKKAIVNPWKKLIDFFRPVFDTAGGDSPSSELRFFKPSQRGKKALEINYDEDVDELESWIDYGPSSVDFYDGPELYRYLSDESGKLKKISIVDRHNTVVPCCEIDGVYKGKMLHTTTIEKDDKDPTDSGMAGSEYKRLIDMSDPFKRDANGRTLTGLYSLFLPAYETMYIDRYGEPDVEKAKQFFLARREALKNHPKELASFIRKNPFTLREAFEIGNDKCHFNAIILKNVISDLSWSAKDLLECGNFEWKDNKPFTQVYWDKTKKGRWYIPKNFEMPDPQFSVEKKGSIWVPKNTVQFTSACDPYENKQIEGKMGSIAASHVLCRFDKSENKDFFQGNFVSQYFDRPKMIGIFHEDMAKQCFFFGSRLLVERNKEGGLMDFFTLNGMDRFLSRLPGQVQAGVYAGDENKVLLLNLLETWVEEHGVSLLFPNLGTQLMDFQILKSEKYDLVMSAGWTLVDDFYKKVKFKPEEKPVQIEDYIPEWLLED